MTITPISVTPSVAPIERANCVSAVAEPIARIGHDVLDRDHEHLHHQAEPDPRDDHVPRRLEARRRGVHAREQEEPGAEDHRPGEGIRPVVAASRDPLPGDRARDHGADEERRQHDARGGRRGADHALHEERHVGDRPDHRHRRDPDRGHPGRNRSRSEQVVRQDRLGRAPLHEGECREEDRRPPGVRRGPRRRPTGTAGRPRRARAAGTSSPRRAAPRRGSRPRARAAASASESRRRSRRARRGRPGCSRRRSSASSRCRRSVRRGRGRRSTRQ